MAPLVIAAIVSAVASLVSVGAKLWTDRKAPMSKAQEQMNEFNSEEASLARDFSAQEAEINRDWQEEMAAKYNSIQGKIEQARQAGVNPMFAVTGSAVSPPSYSSPSVSAPAASGTTVPGINTNFADIAQTALGFAKVKAEVENMNASTRSLNAKALVEELQAKWVDKLNAQEITESVKRIEVADVDIQVKNAQIQELTAKALEHTASAEERKANVSLIAANVANVGQDTMNKAEQFKLISAQILNTESDTKHKDALVSLVLSQTKSENLLHKVYTIQPEYYKALTKESKNRYREINHRVAALEQQYGHNKIMHGLQEYASQLEQETIEFHNPQNQFGQAIKWLVEVAAEVLSFGGYVAYNTSHNTTSSSSSSTVTTVDGNPPIVRKPIGFK